MTDLPETTSCPSWCGRRHGVLVGEEDLVHVSGALQVRSTVLRLWASTDPLTGLVDGPYVVVRPQGREETEYALHEAEALIDALTQLVEQGGTTRYGVEQPGERFLSPRAGA